MGQSTGILTLCSCKCTHLFKHTLIHVFISSLCVCVVVLSGNKRVSFEEFLPVYLSCQKKKDEGTMEDFIEGLKVFDKEGNGFINSAELRHVLTSLGKKGVVLLGE